jgi:hypothetical protein
LVSEAIALSVEQIFELIHVEGKSFFGVGEVGPAELQIGHPIPFHAPKIACCQEEWSYCPIGRFSIRPSTYSASGSYEDRR